MSELVTKMKIAQVSFDKQVETCKFEKESKRNNAG
jgi:hypothetical protein